MLTRREVVLAGALAALEGDTPRMSMTLGENRWDKIYTAALRTIQGNVEVITEFPRPVLKEGAGYSGIWLECGPLEGLIARPFSPALAASNHEIFFQLQREDGYLPYSVRNNYVGASQIQMVVPIAATAWELYQNTRDAKFLQGAYQACSRWDDWLKRYRNTRGTGLCEAFCTYDTGHDHSPRFAGVPNQCRDKDARLCPQLKSLPYLAPDLSATVYGGRTALAAMAREMGKIEDESRWLESAGQIRHAILSRLFDEETQAFYDRNAEDQFVRVRGDAITRVMGEHVADGVTFEAVYKAQLRNPHAFWATYPFPSIALDDPSFVRPIPRNSWGGASQALTALRAPRWMEHYGKYADLTTLMSRWVEAIVRAEDFWQQMDPETGEFTRDQRGYTPAALVFLDFTRRLYGVRAAADRIEWNCRIPPGSPAARSREEGRWGSAELRNHEDGSTLLFRASSGGSEKQIGKVRGECRLLTGTDGRPRQLVGTAQRQQHITLSFQGQERKYTLDQDEALTLEAHLGFE